MSSAQRSPVPNRRAALRDWLGSPTRAKVAGAVLLTTALYVWRSGDGIAHPQLWAEDGRVFFDEARTFGPSSLVTPYAGYLHTVQRLVALAATPFSATLAPQLYVAATVALVACVAFVVATAEDRHAWLLAGSMMLVPVGGEIFGNLTNVQWFGQVGLLGRRHAPAPGQERPLGADRLRARLRVRRTLLDLRGAAGGVAGLDGQA